MTVELAVTAVEGETVTYRTHVKSEGVVRNFPRQKCGVGRNFPRQKCGASFLWTGIGRIITEEVFFAVYNIHTHIRSAREVHVSAKEHRYHDSAVHDSLSVSVKSQYFS